MKRLNYSLLGLSLIFFSQFAVAKPIQGISFSHEDWEIYCSNTGTCQAAGYQDDYSSDKPASILITREAGSKQAPEIEYALSTSEDLPKKQLENIHLYVNGKDLGAVHSQDLDVPILGTLTRSQADALFKQASQKVSIEFKNSQQKWMISDKGMTAVLLKMDDFQQRVGTTQALIKKGQKDESTVLKAQAKFIVKKVKTANQPYLTLTPKSKQ